MGVVEAAELMASESRRLGLPVRQGYGLTECASVVALDAAIGRIVDALEKRHWLENTLIVFQSDNGGAVPMKFPTGDGDVKSAAADNGILREGKGSLHEGGVRVVAFASMPGKIKPKSIVTGHGVRHLWHTVQGSATSSNSSQCLMLTPRRVCSS